MQYTPEKKGGTRLLSHGGERGEEQVRLVLEKGRRGGR